MKLILDEDFIGDVQRVWCLAWSPDGACLASCGSEHVVRIWEWNERWYCSAILEDIHTRAIRSLAWSPDGCFLASASFDSTVSIWEKTGSLWQQVGLLEGHENEVKSVSWHPTRNLIATCGRDKTIWIWEVLGSCDYECVDVKQAHSQDVKMVKWHPQGMFLASASYDDSIKIWMEENEEEWNCVETLKSHDSTVWALAFSTDGREMVSCSDDKTIKIWNIPDPIHPRAKIQLHKTLTGYHNRTIFSIDISLEGLIATGCGDDGIRIFGKEEFEEDVSLLCVKQESHESDVNCVAWNPHRKKQLASGGDDGAIRIWILK